MGFSQETKSPSISVGLGITHLGNSSVRCELGIFLNDESEADAIGYVVYGHVDRASNVSVAIPRLNTPISFSSR